MGFLLFIIVYPLVWMISRLPMRVLYIVSDFFFFLIFYVFNYRKKVVMQNLTLAFPEKDEKEKRGIMKAFFKHFIDIMIESVKGLSISEKEMQRRYVFKNPELVKKYVAEERSITMVGAHQANWEWSISMPLWVKVNSYAAYTKLANPYFEKVVKRMREKFGFIGYKTTNTIKNIQNNFKNGTQGLYLLLSDQSPQLPKTYYWSSFMGVNVPVHTGAEVLAKRFDMVIINYSVTKVKRGYFEVDFELISDQPKDHENFELTEKYLRITERNIKKQPEYYLWSHRRFKHRDSYQEWKENFAPKNKTKK
ncbi:MAG: lipid A biosynthesis acyltransferase [Flavobacteriaceae bacterium]|nr:lipid A biosynthesis acyltransferase [Flavobacteriaceae bacterium]|tara:strand:+ start:89750 stop:90670 length:921 start_codon:yes stop_codon:yes gene_type:complete